MKVSDLFIKCLESHGIDTIFGVPGEENLDLYESIRKSSIKFIVTRNEQTAVFMAANYGRLTGKTGIALSTLGPGATNLLTGVAYAQLGGMPVMVITGQKPLKKSKQGKFQIIDVVGIMKPVTKFSAVVVDGARVPSLIANSFLMAESEKPGAVHLELPEDIAGEETGNYSPIVLEKIRRPQIDEKMLHNLINILENAKSPLILIGAGANRKRITNYLTKFIQKYNIPFFCSQMGKGVVDERLSQYIGTAALTSGDYIHKSIEKADLILAVGHDVIEKPTNIIEEGKTKVVHINFTPADIDMLYDPYLQVIGDIGNTFWQLYEADINQKWNFDEIYKTSSEGKKLIENNSEKHYKNDVMMPARLVNEIREFMKDDDILTLDNGLYKLWFARNYNTYKPNTLLLDNALATMGAGYSSGLAAKILNPDKKVLTVTGDGGFMMNLGDISTAVNLGLDMTVIILNDNAYGMIRWKQIDHGFEDWGLGLSNPDFVKLAESFGAKGYKVEKADDFKETLQRADKEKGIKIIDLRFVYPQEIK